MTPKNKGMHEVYCKQCGGSRMRRLPREGFMQKNIYAIFGYYPWECPVCRVTQYVHLRGKRAHRESEWNDASTTEMRVGE
ncbi:MAG TPA: hypothetical protein VG844_03785 [Terracidiphilus sp.]|jgi:hypothetical protein|nr:hypothetical protein [Terracidiphilus sp.]